MGWPMRFAAEIYLCILSASCSACPLLQERSRNGKNEKDTTGSDDTGQLYVRSRDEGRGALPRIAREGA